MNKTRRFNHLINFNNERGLIACENIIRDLDEVLYFDHSTVNEIYYPEDMEYDIQMCFRANDEELNIIIEYLDNHGFKDNYSIYNVDRD